MSVNLSKKPSKPFLGGIYRITQDGYILCATRRSTTLEGSALRPSLEYGQLVYRITVAKKKTTTIRAHLIVREVWGSDMQAPVDFNEFLRRIDAYNTWLKESYREKAKDKDKAPSRGLCPYCGERPIKVTSLAKTCGAPKCRNVHKRAVERLRAKKVAAVHHIKSNEALVISDMPCPWATPGKLGAGPEGVSWYSAQADPMTLGVWMSGNLETKQGVRRAA
jgi:hypothetical protein